MAVTYKEITYEEAINLVIPRIIAKGDVYAKAASDYFDTYGYTPETIAYVFEGEMPDVSSVVARNGTVSMRITTPDVSATTTPSVLNSNTSKTVTATMSPVLDTVVDSETGKMSLKQASSGAFKFFTGSVAPAIAAASVGISLGKTIDSTLYNLNPDFFDANGMSALNPETWASITNGDDSVGAKLFNYVFGIDDNGNTQAYISEEAYAYMAQWLATQGFFDDGTIVPGSGNIPNSTFTYPIYILDSFAISTGGVNIGTIVNIKNMKPYVVGSKSTNPYYSGYGVWAAWPADGPTPLFDYQVFSSMIEVEPGWFKPVNVLTEGQWVYIGLDYYTNSIPANNYSRSEVLSWYFPSTIVNEPSIGAAIDGIDTQSGATIPTDYNTQWTNPQTTLTSLQQQYPDLWQKAVPITTLQPDGTTTTTNYIPVPMPNATSATDTQPTSSTDTQSQTQTQVGTQTLEAIKQLISELIATPTDNPPNTGDNSSPEIVPVIGSSSGLWAIYHPTKAQIDSFGQWLWSDNVVNQIKALMFSPIDAVISLHKVYCQPIDAGTSTIQVGYLNSNISSAYVEQIHVYTSCGSVSLQEYFGNVFDYSPHTSVHLYLPFIGIVPLDVESVMRSTIYVKYGVDILTGDCLASVVIMRDGNSSVQYQYSGNAAEHFPLTAGNYMGLVSGAISAAASATAGVVAGIAGHPASAIGGLAGAATRALSARANVARSGGFSGNAGAMGGKTPYLIIERPQTKVADNFEHYQGYPTNAFVRVGNCNGYIRASRVHVEPVPATDKELDMIRAAFMSGVIV